MGEMMSTCLSRCCCCCWDVFQPHTGLTLLEFYTKSEGDVQHELPPFFDVIGNHARAYCTHPIPLHASYTLLQVLFFQSRLVMRMSLLWCGDV